MNTLRTRLRAHLIPLGLLLLASLYLAGCGGGSSDDHSGHDHSGHDHHDHSGHDHSAHGDDHDVAATTTGHQHKKAGETCFICDAGKRDKGRLWCREHGRYEDRCWICHPELEDKNRLWCAEHALYEDECFLCHPELKEAPAGSPSASSHSDDDDDHAGHDQARHDHAGHDHGSHASGADLTGLYCNEHQMAELECGICQPGLATSLAPGENLKIRFPSGQSADRAGVRTAEPLFAEGTPSVRALCEARYNLNALARVSPLAGGVIRSVSQDLGDTVEAGDVLVTLHSATLATAKSEFLAALVQRDITRQSLERERRLQEQKIAAEKDLLAAEAAYRTAGLAVASHRQKLLNYGLTEAELAEVEATQDTSALLAVRAPFAGTLIERTAVVGEAVEVGAALFTVADLSTRWLALSIPADALGRLALGQTVEASFAELGGRRVVGRLNWISATVDPRTRLVEARALVADAAPALKNGLYGEAHIAIGSSRTTALLPRAAVQRHEGADFVFVRDEPDLFSLRRVTLGSAQGDRIEVLEGLSDHEAVVMEGSFLVMSEFLKSRLGAGCADH